MKYKFRNLLMVTLGASYLVMHTPSAFAKAEAAAPSKHKRKQGAPLTSASLVTDMQKAVAFIAKSAKDKISMKSKEARPFWSALEDCSKALDQMESGQKAKDGSMLKGLDALGRALPQLSASWGVLRGGHKGLQVGSGVIALSKSYDTYLFNYGPAVARKKKGGEVTDAEKAKLAKARSEVSKLKGELAALKSKAKPKSYEVRLIADLLLLCTELDKVTGDDLKAYSKYLYQLDRLTYTVDGYGDVFKVWYPDNYKGWTDVTSGCTEMYVEFTVDVSTYYESWDYSSVSVSSYGDYYEVTSSTSSITTEEESTFESYAESYSEESATEESSEESSEISEEVTVDEDEHSTFAEEVEDGSDDEDGDGVSNEDDTDNDNDGVSNDDDSDDDGDGVADSDDADEDQSADDSSDDSADDDGDSDDDGSADDGGGDDGGGDDGGGDE